jgi:hypothetical protein
MYPNPANMRDKSLSNVAFEDLRIHVELIVILRVELVKALR